MSTPVTPQVPSPSAFSWLRERGRTSDYDGKHSRALFAYIDTLQRHNLSVRAENEALRQAGNDLADCLIPEWASDQIALDNWAALTTPTPEDDDLLLFPEWRRCGECSGADGYCVHCSGPYRPTQSTPGGQS